MFNTIRNACWRLRYRRGRIITFCSGYDLYSDVIIVENKIATTGTVLYRERPSVIPWGTEESEFGPIEEATISELHKRLSWESIDRMANDEVK